MKVVLDASALLAYLQDESGSDAVEVVLRDSVISSVNWAEVVQKSIAAGAGVVGMRDDLEALGLSISEFTAQEAEMAAQLWQQTRHYGLSLGDRACLSLALRLNVPVLTTDRVWANLGLDLTVNVIRE